MDDKTLRAYLLGDLPGKEQEEIDGWVLTADDAYDLLNAAEDDLIEDSLRGKLTAHELERLNSYFLVTEERQRKLQFSRSFHNFIQLENHHKSEPPFWETVTSFFRVHAAVAYAASALFLLLVIGNVWFISRGLRLQQHLEDIVQQREILGHQVEEKQAQLQSFQLALLDLQAIQTVSLSPLALRSPGDTPRVTLTPNTHVINFELKLLEDEHFDSYKAVLSGAGDRVFFTGDDLHASGGLQIQNVIFSVPVDNLKPGEYRIQLTGIDNSKSQDVGSFRFLVVRQ